MIRAATREELDAFEIETGYCPTKKCTGIVNEVDGKVAALILYDFWTHTSAQAHISVSNFKHFIDPAFVRAIFEYPFEMCGKSMLITVTPESAKGSLAISRWLGFVEVYRQKDGWKQGEDMILKEMRRENCRWLQKKAA